MSILDKVRSCGCERGKVLTLNPPAPLPAQPSPLLLGSTTDGTLRVYLPTLIQPRLCYKIPLVVGYTCVAVGKVGHFTALVGVEGELQHLPLVDEHGDDLPVR